MLDFDGTSQAELRLALVFVILVNVHVENSVTGAEQVSYKMILGCIATSLLDQVLEEVNSGNVSSRDKSTHKRQLKVTVFSPPRFV